jgi:prepilin-type N-terminal cleavage/methylation domain-containing protein
MRQPEASTERGYSLIELLITMAITTVIMGATMTALGDAMKATESATLLTNLNGGLRTAMDLVVRDLLQVGQGLPAGRVVFIPSGPNATPIKIPGPPNTDFTLAGASELTAVVPGPDLGPIVNGQATDVITTLAVDSSFDSVNLTQFAADGRSVTVRGCPVANPLTCANIGDDLNGDDILEGDLIMLVKRGTSLSTLVQVTRVVGQQIFFEANDSLNLNQGLGVDGTAPELRVAAPNDVQDATGVVPTIASRIRMISYYVDATTDPARPRLIRRIGNGDPTTFDNTLGTAVAFDIESLRLTYDLVDGVNNPAAVRFVQADLDGTGACSPDPCSPNNVRKVTVTLLGRSKQPMKHTQAFFRNSLITQVSLRSLAFVDRYR